MDTKDNVVQLPTRVTESFEPTVAALASVACELLDEHDMDAMLRAGIDKHGRIAVAVRGYTEELGFIHNGMPARKLVPTGLEITHDPEGMDSAAVLALMDEVEAFLDMIETTLDEHAEDEGE